MNEFICVFFDSSGWFFQTDQQVTGGPFPAITPAINAALATCGAGEADFDVVEDSGDYYRLVRCDCDSDIDEDVGSLYDLYNPFGG